MASQIERGSVPMLGINEPYKFKEINKAVRFQVEWTSKSYGIICDLDLNIYCYDERARFIEKLDVTSKRSKDHSCVLVSDTDGASTQANIFSECVKVDFRLVNKETSAIMLFLDGGPRNFQFVQNITLRSEGVAARSVIPGQAAPPALFEFTEKSRKDFQGVALAVIYKDGWHPIPDIVADVESPIPYPSSAIPAEEKKDSKAKSGESDAKGTKDTKNKADAKDTKLKADTEDTKTKADTADASKGAEATDANSKTKSASADAADSHGVVQAYEPVLQFVAKPIFEPIFVSSQKAKTEKVLMLVVSHVPALEKFRPRLFDNVNEVCAALSSEALPGLKDKFTAIHSGLPVTQFTEVIFRQLFKTHPKITNSDESAYTVAMIQEMFSQIDYNGDGAADWDEFTTFCIQTASNGKSASGANIDEYIIEYQEDSLMRDRVLSPYRPVASMKFISETKRFCVIPDEADKVLMLDEKFRVRSHISPSHIIVKNAMGITVTGNDDDADGDAKRVSSGLTGERKIVVYDIIFLNGKELYAFSCSDHSITICREHGGVGNRPGTHVLYNRLYHEKLHTKLCWSPANSILCSVANRTIYGWDIDKSMPLFQVSRHSDIVTDFIACDNLDTFITCSMDKRIVMWSAHTRRVKGIFAGHKRGVRCISSYEYTLLSAGFETDARTWDLYTKENIAVLKGHRFPIADAKLMCELAQNEREYRAITVDESGELRLWNIYVKEKASDAVTLPAIQVFQMHNPMTPLSSIKSLAIPCNAVMSTSYYSDIVAVGTKLLRFLPEKNTKEFVPPSCSVFNEASSELCTLVGKSMFKYDVCKGVFTSVIQDAHSSDLTAIALDSPRGRRVFIGCGNGELLLVNYMSGGIISSVPAHKKEINSVVSIQGARNSVYSCSADGSIVICEEHKGDLHIHSTIENAFGEGVGVTSVQVAQSINVLVASSSGSHWGLWHASTCKRIALFNEDLHGGAVCEIAILGASRDEADLKWLDVNFSKIPKATVMKREKEKLLTVAVCTPAGVYIYTMDVSDIRGVHSYTLVHEKSMYITNFSMIRYPSGDSVNYASAGKSKSSSMTNDVLDSAPKLAAGALTFIVTTDEGGIIVWDIDKVRLESESKFRKRYPNSAKSKRKADNGTAGTPNTPGTPSAALDELDADYENDDIIINADSKLEEESHVVSVGIVSEYKSESFFVTDTYDKSIHARHHGEGVLPKHLYVDYENHPRFLEKVRCSAQFLGHLDSACVLVPMHEHGCIVTASHDGYHRVWNLDKVCLGEMPLPNLTDKMKVPKEPIVGTLGTTPETDMKHWSRPKVAEGAAPASASGNHGGHGGAAAASTTPLFLNPWKFIQERIAITAVHHDLARKLVDLCLNKTSDRKVKHSRRDTMRNFGFLDKERTKELTAIANNTQAESLIEKESEASRLRNYALMSMNEEIGPREDGPPVSIPTKDEIKLLEMTEKLSNTLIRRDVRDIYGFDEATGRLGSPGSPVHDQDKFIGHNDGVTPVFLTGYDEVLTRRNSKSLDGSSRNESVSREGRRAAQPMPMSPSTPTRNFGGKNALWNLATEGGGKKGKIRIAPAFSEESLNQSMADNTIDEESFTLLKTFSMSRNNVHQYMNTTKGTVLLRNPTLSTSIELPAIEGMRRAEIYFGPQKDYYHNAELVLNERDNLNREKMRNAITLGRIEHNVKKIGSMMHLLDPLHVDEVKIPLESKAKEYKEKMLQEDKKMQVRLLQSASRVPTFISPNKDADVGDVNHLMLNKFSGTRLKKLANAEALAKSLDEVPTELSWDEDPKPVVIDVKHQNNISFLNQLGNVRRPLDKSSVTSILDKVTYATAAIHHEKADLQYSYSSSGLGTKAFKQNLPQAAKEALEKKVKMAIRDEYNEKIRQDSLRERNKERMAAEKDIMDALIDSGGDPSTYSRPSTSSKDSPIKVTLDTRSLLPFYKAEDVRHFMDIFVKVDEDFSGDLDMEEWVRLFSSINNTVPEQEARSIFMKFKNEKGFLTVNELIPVVFSKATKDQMKLITKFCLAEIMKPEAEIVVLTFAEVDQLFEIYDVENVGFVALGFIKEKIHDMPLADVMIQSFLAEINEIDDDEMVNHREFGRMFKHLVSKAELLAQRDEEMRQDMHAAKSAKKK